MNVKKQTQYFEIKKKQHCRLLKMTQNIETSLTTLIVVGIPDN